ncbi:hypothetical protein HF576_08690 [Microbacterium sp. CFH 90308]|uniref:LGFP repeat-containing protein n=1 Tax=Microbacterium salsuginis TaxID=2722803 RepID=A0ABX1KA85_9MICO|nr:hypothetical protein [Microbacterium sp. CFH 90308]NLP83923.1 hypothetical protein [Microbacterium sp. CFH 90308]
MNEAQIQSFLVSQVPTCQAGYTCLRDKRDTSTNRSADAMCQGYSGAANEPASRIIARVAQSCGINPQVILATLQKEQGLVTHTWPSDWRYTIAMGQGCPDTAACDTRYYGFFNQVYGAAWQFKRYANPPGTSQYFTWYAPGRTWNLRFHPDASCGSAPVYIENQATANLYYYTPYQPNRAALAAGYGTGDACSSYGNRNFYNYFTDWFGSTGYPVSGLIASIWSSQGGGSGWLGQPSGTMAWSSAAGGGWYQSFRGGTIFAAVSGAMAALRSDSLITHVYLAGGGPSYGVGWPAGPEQCGAFGCRVPYEQGTIAWSNETGQVNPVVGAIAADWIADGGVNNPIGGPASRMTTVGGAAPGWHQSFVRGKTYVVAGGVTSTLRADSGLARRYDSNGGPTGAYGWPKGDEVCGVEGCSIAFDSSTSVWDYRTGAINVIPAAGAAIWKDSGGVDGWLGAPMAAAGTSSVAGGGTIQAFRRGTVYVSASGHASGLRSNSGIVRRYESLGGVAGPLGWPLKSEDCRPGGCAIVFVGAVSVWDQPTGTISDVSGAVSTEWTARGGLDGWLGAPTAPMQSTTASGSGWFQTFRGGTVYVKRGGAVSSLRANSGLAQMYQRLGGPGSDLGWPLGGEACASGQCSIAFEGGTLVWTQATGQIRRE